jgi:hypothetical protein
VTLNAWRPNQLFVLNVLYNVALQAAQARWCILNFTDFLGSFVVATNVAYRTPSAIRSDIGLCWPVLLHE